MTWLATSREATNEDGSWEYAAVNYDCDGNCLNDEDGDGVCDELKVLGCQDDMACNYDMSATDAGSCDYADEGFDRDGNCVIGEDCNGVRRFSGHRRMWRLWRFRHS